jgi:hypothetical protein
MALIKEPYEILHLNLPVTVRVTLTRWVQYNGGLRGYIFKNSVAERTVTTKFQLMDLKRLMIVSGQCKVEILDDKVIEQPEIEEPEELLTSAEPEVVEEPKHDTAVLERVETPKAEEVNAKRKKRK